MKKFFLRKFFALALLFFCVPLFLTSPAGAFWEFGISDEAELGRKFNVLVRSRLPLVLDPEVVDYVEDLVQRLSSHLPPQPFPFQVSVLRHNAVNAFATPGGYIFVHTGLIMAMETEGELAGVLAHEMAHVTQRHVAHNIEKSQKMGILGLLGMLAGIFIGGEGGQAAVAGSMAASQAAMLSYSRSDEYDADQVGMGYLLAAGYAPQNFVDSFKIMRQKVFFSGGREIPTYLSTHPALNDRINDMQARVNAMSAQVRNRRENDTRFLRIQALVYGHFGEENTAREFFNRQLSGKNRCNSLMGLGILNGRTNRIKEAGDFFDQAMNCAPKDELVMREAGVFNYTKGESGKSEEYLRKAIALKPNDYYATFYLARLMADRGNTTEAGNYYREILRRLPEDSEVHYYYAMALGQEKKLFAAHLHMAYCYLYANSEARVEQYIKKAAQYADGADQKKQLEDFKKKYAERKEFW